MSTGPEAEARDRVNQAQANANQLVVRLPPERQKLGPFTIVCFIINRTVGSGIFVLPAIVLEGTGSVGVSLILWVIGAIVALASVLVWLELGLSIPRFEVEDGSYQSIPRSGGEKNYLEYIFRRPQFLATCIYGWLFIIYGNLAGNAIAFGSYVMHAAGHAPGDTSNYAAIRGLAVAVLTGACILHAVWRQGGIVLNNAFAVFKILILLFIIIVGFVAMAGASFGHGKPVVTEDIGPRNAFSGSPKGFTSVVTSFLYILYPFSGFEQPFYVLSEVSQPHKIFAKSTIWTMIMVGIVYLLVNIVYMGVVPKTVQSEANLDIATQFFQRIFQNETATRVMAAIIALSIVGNIIVMTFTACRVKQEIAKEGILPFSRFFAQSKTTLVAKLWYSPTPALFLHWCFSMLLVAVTSGTKPLVAYSVLVATYSYIFVVIVGLFVAAGLLWTRYHEGEVWLQGRRFKPWGDWLWAAIYAVVCLFLLVAIFVRPSKDSPFSYENQEYHWFVPPTVGLASLGLGVVYFFCLRYLIPLRKGAYLSARRFPVIVEDGHGGYVQVEEIIDVEWRIAARHMELRNRARGSQV